MRIARFAPLLAAAVLFTVLPARADIPAADERTKMERVADRLERTCRLAVETAETKGEPALRGFLWAKTAAALATFDLDRGLRWFDEGRANGILEVPALAPSAFKMLALLTRDDRAGRLLEHAARSKDPELAAAAVAVLPVESAQEALGRIALVDAGSQAGAEAILLCALEVQTAGGDGARVARAADPANGTARSDEDTAEAQIPTEADLLRLLANEDGAGLREFLAGFREDGTFKRRVMNFLNGFSLCIDRFGERSGRTASLVARLAAASSDMTPRMRFMIFARIASLFRGRVPDALAGRLAADWDERLLDGPFEFNLGGSTFYAIRALLDRDAERAAAMARALAGFLNRMEDPSGFYHAVGTLAGLIARTDPALALEFAGSVRKLEWHVQALRCVYRGWAGRDPQAALTEFERRFPDRTDLAEAVRRDLTLDLAAGMAPRDPRQALSLLEALPDCPFRTNHGLFLVAPALARVDLDAALALLAPPADRADFQYNSVLPLARILMDLAGTEPGRFEPPDFAEACYPATEWPGPHYSQPLRVHERGRRE